MLEAGRCPRIHTSPKSWFYSPHSNSPAEPPAPFKLETLHRINPPSPDKRAEKPTSLFFQGEFGKALNASGLRYDTLRFKRQINPAKSCVFTLYALLQGPSKDPLTTIKLKDVKQEVMMCLGPSLLQQMQR